MPKTKHKNSTTKHLSDIWQDIYIYIYIHITSLEHLQQPLQIFACLES